MVNVTLGTAPVSFAETFDWSNFFTPPVVIEAASPPPEGPEPEPLEEEPVTEADDLGQLTEDDFIPQEEGVIVTYEGTTVTMVYEEVTDEPVIEVTTGSTFTVL